VIETFYSFRSRQNLKITFNKRCKAFCLRGVCVIFILLASVGVLQRHSQSLPLSHVYIENICVFGHIPYIHYI